MNNPCNSHLVVHRHLGLWAELGVKLSLGYEAFDANIDFVWVQTTYSFCVNKRR